MRNLLLLIARHHRLVLFVVFEALALGWYASANGHARGAWIRMSLAANGAWMERVARVKHVGDLASSNDALLKENAELRAALLAREVVLSDTSGWVVWEPPPVDTAGLAAAAVPDSGVVVRTAVSGQKASGPRGIEVPLRVYPARVIRASDDRSANYLILDAGTADGIAVGQGVLALGAAVGRVHEVTGQYALVLPLVHTGIEWSARVGADGPAARLVWDGKSLGMTQLRDVPRSTVVVAGDTVLATGFQGFFPAGTPFGTVVEEGVDRTGEFKVLTVQLFADYRNLRYVEVIDVGDREQLDALGRRIPQPE